MVTAFGYWENIMIKSISDKVELNNGVKMPGLGFGVFQTKDGADEDIQKINSLDKGIRIGPDPDDVTF